MHPGVKPFLNRTELPITIDDEVGEMVGGFNRLVVKIKENEERILNLAHYDVLTKLPNRLGFIKNAEFALKIAKMNNSSVALMFIDIDGFKLVNDRYGHEFGDKMLRDFAMRLRGAFRESDTVARLGGDEFVVLLMDVQSENHIVDLVGSLERKLSKTYLIDGLNIDVGASIGVAFLCAGCDIDSLLAQADKAMYSTKRGKATRLNFDKA